MEVQGKIKMIDETKTYGNNGFRKRELVVTTEEQYPQHILIEFVQGQDRFIESVPSWTKRKSKYQLKRTRMGKPTGGNQIF